MLNIDDPVAKIRLSPGFQTTKSNRKNLENENFPNNTAEEHSIEAVYQDPMIGLNFYLIFTHFEIKNSRIMVNF